MAFICLGFVIKGRVIHSILWRCRIEPANHGRAVNVKVTNRPLHTAFCITSSVETLIFVLFRILSCSQVHHREKGFDLCWVAIATLGQCNRRKKCATESSFFVVWRLASDAPLLTTLHFETADYRYSLVPISSERQVSELPYDVRKINYAQDICRQSVT